MSVNTFISVEICSNNLLKLQMIDWHTRQDWKLAILLKVYFNSRTKVDFWTQVQGFYSSSLSYMVLIFQISIETFVSLHYCKECLMSLRTRNFSLYNSWPFVMKNKVKSKQMWHYYLLKTVCLLVCA